MGANTELLLTTDSQRLRGFANMLYKENRAWWGTYRWWTNALIWPLLLGGLVANMLLVSSAFPMDITAEVARAGGTTAYVMQMGMSVFFEFGIQAIGIGVIILSHDLLIGERHNGVTEWILTKPVTRHAYILAKFIANATHILLFLITIPAFLTYVLLSLRLGAPFPVLSFCSGVGIMIVHSLFFLTLVLMLGVSLDSRPALLGIALGFLLGGNLLAGLVKPLIYLTPSSLPRVAALVAGGQVVRPELLWPPLLTTILWCGIFSCVALAKFRRAQF